MRFSEIASRLTGWRFRGLDPERVRDAQNVRGREATLAALHAADVGPVDTREVRKLLLRDAALLRKRPDGAAERDVSRELGTPWHAADAPTWVYRI